MFSGRNKICIRCKYQAGGNLCKVSSLLMFAISFVFLVFSLSEESFAQKKKIHNLPTYDKQKLHFGFTLGINTSDFRIVPVFNLRKIDTLYVVESKGSSGFNLGIVSDYRLGEYFNLRFIPALCFAQRDISYKIIGSDSILLNLPPKTVESTLIELPVDIKFKSARVNNYRMYVLAGGKYSIDMASQAKVEIRDKDNPAKAIVKIRRYDFGYSLGFGIDYYLEFFKLATEIRVYNGLNNLLVRDNTVFSQSINKLNSRMVLISFTFE